MSDEHEVRGRRLAEATDALYRKHGYKVPSLEEQEVAVLQAAEWFRRNPDC